MLEKDLQPTKENIISTFLKDALDRWKYSRFVKWSNSNSFDHKITSMAFVKNYNEYICSNNTSYWSMHWGLVKFFNLFLYINSNNKVIRHYYS